MLGAKESKQLVAAFGFKLNEEAKKLEPCSVGVYSAKMLAIAAAERVDL